MVYIAMYVRRTFSWGRSSGGICPSAECRNTYIQTHSVVVTPWLSLLAVTCFTGGSDGRVVRVCFVVLNLSGSSQQRKGRGREECTSFSPLPGLLCLPLLTAAPRDREGELLSSSPSPHFSSFSVSLARNLASHILKFCSVLTTLHSYYCGCHGNV
jgi:hypothetical protein